MIIQIDTIKQSLMLVMCSISLSEKITLITQNTYFHIKQMNFISKEKIDLEKLNSISSLLIEND